MTHGQLAKTAVSWQRMAATTARRAEKHYTRGTFSLPLIKTINLLRSIQARRLLSANIEQRGDG
ncbi:hypothetical protein L249_8825 [Ophiocordyceps polyrhachis-furcata BCC 54312]|uniref:Uncharacterized protein n=1 Tax=Ophiocordyceps polyrhachis-furcata BCC 54312 TaxID=1330021 RepID=A0A367L260_9HYPO|nr:hypothetical protein L249_8825 [Ophiocordyceps polyrhachis-furcata BCC 54312]